MPTYLFECEKCGASEEEFRWLSERKDPPPKCKCGSEMTRNYGKTRAGNARYHTPIELFSMAPETPEQRRTLEAVGATFTPEGVPLAHDRAEKNRLMEAAGTTEMS